jgi:hypothetical protein
MQISQGEIGGRDRREQEEKERDKHKNIGLHRGDVLFHR